MRIFVTGNAGAGKSTLGKQLAARLELPFYSLDKIVWQPGWKKTPPKEQQQEIAKLVQKDHWIIDGVSYQVQAVADVVIFLDVPRRICFARVFQRNRKHLFASRPDLPPNCPEILIIPMLIKIIWRFPGRVRPNILAEKQRRNARTFIHIRSKTDLESLRDLPDHPVA